MSGDETLTDARPTAWHQRPLAPARTLPRDFLGQDFAELSRLFRTQGIVRIPPPLDEQIVAALSREANELFSSRELDWNGHTQFGGAACEEFLQGKPALGSALLHPLIWTLALDALGTDPFLAYVRAYRIEPIAPKQYRAFQPHIDGHGLELKAMILLSDVPANGQAMRYWLGSHTACWDVRSSRDTLFTNEELEELGPPIVCSGRAGSIFLFNTNGIHSGTRNLTRRRDVVVLTITRGERLYRIPRLDPSVHRLVASDPYLRMTLRVGREQTVGRLLPPVNVDALRAEFLSNVAVRPFHDARRARTFGRQGTCSAVTLKRLALRASHVATKPRAPVQVHSLSAETRPACPEALEALVEQDLERGIDLPLRVPYSVRDPLRDIALCEIRDVALRDQSRRHFFCIAVLEKAATVSAIAAQTTDCLPMIRRAAFLCRQVGGYRRMDRSAYLALLEDMQWSVATAASFPLLRTALLFALAAVESLGSSRSTKPGDPAWAEIDALHARLAHCYVALANTSNSSEPGTIDLAEVSKNER